MMNGFIKRYGLFWLAFLIMVGFQLLHTGITRNEVRLFPDFEALFLDSDGELYARTVQGRLVQVHDGLRLLKNTPAFAVEHAPIAVYEGMIVVVQRGNGKCVEAYRLDGEPLSEPPKLPDTFRLDSKQCGDYRIERSHWVARITYRGATVVRRGTVSLYNACVVLCDCISLAGFCSLSVLLLLKERSAKRSAES